MRGKRTIIPSEKITDPANNEHALSFHKDAQKKAAEDLRRAEEAKRADEARRAEELLGEPSSAGPSALSSPYPSSASKRDFDNADLTSPGSDDSDDDEGPQRPIKSRKGKGICLKLYPYIINADSVHRESYQLIGWWRKAHYKGYRSQKDTA